MKNKSSKDRLTELIPVMFPKGFPSGYVNNVSGWGIPKEELHTKLPDGTYKLLTLDIDFGADCSLRCPHCFRKSKLLDMPRTAELTYDEILRLIREAKELGLRSVKFLGAGEPFENKDLLQLLEEFYKLDIRSAIFTKGAVLGSDALAKKYFESYGIKTSKQLVRRLRELDTSILLGFNSFKRDVQEVFVGQRKSKIENYVDSRDQALINLVEAGFNSFRPGHGTRLAVIIAPIKPENIGEVFEVYSWARVRNIYALSCPTTFSGLGKTELIREKENFDFLKYIYDLEDLYKQIYVWNIENGLTTVDQFREEGVSLYPGCHPCNQVAAGFYVTLKGKVIRCPGRDDQSWIEFDNIRKGKLKENWKASLNYKLASTLKFNYRCIARDGTFFERPSRFYNTIKKRVLEEIGRNERENR